MEPRAAGTHGDVHPCPAMFAELISPRRGADASLTLPDDLLSSIRSPTLVIWGADDPFGDVHVGSRVRWATPNCAYRTAATSPGSTIPRAAPTSSARTSRPDILGAVLTFERDRAEIVAQADTMAGALVGADLTTRVPSCPGWDVGQSSAMRPARPSSAPMRPSPPDDHFRTVEGGGDPGPVLGPWLSESARELADALRSVGPDAPVAGRTSAFYAALRPRDRHDRPTLPRWAIRPGGRPRRRRRMGWSGLAPEMLDFYPERPPSCSAPAVRAPPRHRHPADAHAEWVVDLTETLAWRRAHEKAAVAVRGPLTSGRW